MSSSPPSGSAISAPGLGTELPRFAAWGHSLRPFSDGGQLVAQAGPGEARLGLDTRARDTRRLLAAGARMGAGSDRFCPYLNLPGFLWKELDLLSQSGLGNAGALRAASLANASYLGLEAEIGRLGRPGDRSAARRRKRMKKGISILAAAAAVLVVALLGLRPLPLSERRLSLRGHAGATYRPLGARLPGGE